MCYWNGSYDNFFSSKILLKNMSSLPIGDFQGDGKIGYDNSTKLTPPVPIVSKV